MCVLCPVLWLWLCEHDVQRMRISLCSEANKNVRHRETVKDRATWWTRETGRQTGGAEGGGVGGGKLDLVVYFVIVL